ncbi:MAG: carboxymuconolactone decarboxylase family protein [Phycisphaerales bacterium]|nr:carboxymuconolactone decarboxylase family protein [Phycisphaerales bacterium]
MRIKTTDEDLDRAARSIESNAAFQETIKQLAAGKAPHDMFRAMAAYPPFLAAMETLGESIYPGGSLARDLKELIILQSSMDNDCQFCTHSHIDIASHLGIGEDARSLVHDPTSLSPAYQVALTYARAVRKDSNRVPDALFADLQSHFQDAEIVELTMLVGYINMLNWFNNVIQVEYRGELS